MEATVSKRDSSPAVRLPKPKIRSFREIALHETGLSLEDYVQENPYDNSVFVEFGRAGSEGI